MLLVLGASHHDLELSELDRLAAASDQLRDRLVRLRSAPESPVAGFVMLATCNRIELYLDAVRFHDAVDAATAVIADLAGLPADAASASLTVRAGAPVAAHLFTVAAGLDSMVVGEAEISGQVSRALAAAQADGTATPVLQALFQGAARTAKRVAAETDLGGAGRSVASVALDAAADLRAGEPRSALVVGTGAYARVVLAALRARGCTSITVYSPSGRAADFADRHGALAAAGPAGLAAAMSGADLVVACSGRRGTVVDAELATRVRADRTDELVIVDLALPSDVADDVADVAGVSVLGLHSVAAATGPDHRAAVRAAQDIVIDAVARFEDDQVIRILDPAVVALRQHVSGAIDKEVRRLRTKFPDADVAAEVERSLHRVTQSLLHTPTLRARELARTGDAADYLSALHTLFGIELSGDADAAGLRAG